MGSSGHALLIDCRSMGCEMVPLGADVSVLVTDSNVKHELSGSEYGDRRAQCLAAASALGKQSLRQCDLDELNQNADKLDAVSLRRARHVVTEIRRTQLAADALAKGDFAQCGQLMRESHDSLRDDFEVSCSELDELVRLTDGCDGCHGSRMTGGGFGGCIVSLCATGKVDHLKAVIQENYKGTATFYECRPVDGAYSVVFHKK